MAPVSRRSFLAGLIAAPILAAVAPKEEAAPDVLHWERGGDGSLYCRTLNGEPITGLHRVGDRLYAFTPSRVYEVLAPHARA